MDTTQKFGTPIAVTWTSAGPDGIASAAYSGLSDVVDIETLVATIKASDFLVQFSYKTASGTLGSGPFVSAFAYGAAKDGSAAYTFPGNPANGVQLGLGQAVAVANTADVSNPASLAVAFGGPLPNQLKLRLYNSAGLALAGTSGAYAINKIWLVPVYQNLA